LSSTEFAFKALYLTRGLIFHASKGFDLAELLPFDPVFYLCM
jgi:hypothetical protein